MKLLRLSGVALLVAGLAAAFSGPALAQGTASPQEIVKKVREAAAFLGKSGESGLAEFNKKESNWVWKDTYIFVYDCGKGTIAAHSQQPGLIGKRLAGLKDIKGTLFFVQLCEAAKKPGGAWVEYWWPKPGTMEPSRKISFMLQAGSSPYQVGAGIYDDKMSLDQLDKVVK
ncbi:MAG: cache domain-containing protein [Deltaproteobacteria bacterium]|nr:cache domain-containing protein [Deltaproteobacteria bacterium]